MSDENQFPNLIAALKAKTVTPERQAVRDFYALVPSFMDTPENWHVLVAFLPEEFERELKWPTTQQLIDAYHLARENGHFGEKVH